MPPLWSHPPRGEWIEIVIRRSRLSVLASHPPRGEWIEMSIKMPNRPVNVSHPPRGEWIEMVDAGNIVSATLRLTPRGVSGLKYHKYNK